MGASLVLIAGTGPPQVFLLLIIDTSEEDAIRRLRLVGTSAISDWIGGRIRIKYVPIHSFNRA